MTKRIVVFCAVLALLALSLLVTPSQAQFGSPYGVSRFRWEGVVDGTSYVRITHNRVRVATASGLPVQRQRYDFSDPLSRAAVDLRLVVFDGRGRVRLIESPSRWNDFTAVVRIDDRSGGRDFYSFELRWADRTRDDDYRDPRGRDTVSWSGQVDGEVIVRFQRNQSHVDNLNGQGVWNERYRFSGPLPTTPLQVNLVNTSGRGEILLVEQPNRFNGYTASVRIRDRQSGASHYSFALAWERPRQRYFDDPPQYGGAPSRRGLRWVGRVDGRDILFIRGNRVWFDHQAGQPICEDKAEFFSSLPTSHCDLQVRKLRGRGNVHLLEAPSPYNDYTAKILIDDRDGGDDRYELEVVW